MRVLAIESSCDETSIAIVEDGTVVRSNIIATSAAAFQASGGVIPEEAARKQVESILPVLKQAFVDGLTWNDIDAVAVTKGPGLLGSLLVGTVTARAIASVHGKPLFGIHHTLGHLSSTWLDTAADDAPQFPIITLSASGGHTELWYRVSHTQGSLIGRTRDDAAGEAYDKGAVLLGLPYPGGPSIGKSAMEGNPNAYELPMPLKKEDTLDYSFSGLKTALRYLLRDDPSAKDRINDVAASFQAAINLHLVERIKKALGKYPDVREVHIVGGVSANTELRKLAQEVCGNGVTVRFPKTIRYCTDNAAMIASAAYFLQKELPDIAVKSFETEASLPLTEAVHTMA
ncbi:MAG TPA: tRNA (adenosine(37)-N6)-threonylcarbamoyltransferase complex transferase subunit TsaD [Candidatus Peribacteraceae bacterium]|nr:tRNA (adenosine(37)-N6)-threonylcarbamoyltransferase complex transferase subunit TsaD [Candidatus Peribacteraceae bacterium]